MIKLSLSLLAITLLVLTPGLVGTVWAQDSSGRIDNVRWLENGDPSDPPKPPPSNGSDPDPARPPEGGRGDAPPGRGGELGWWESTTREVVEHPVSPVVASGAGLFSAVLYYSAWLATQTGVWNWGLWLGRLFGFFGGLFRFHRRNRPWGTVYDSVTKQPLDPAYVSLTSATSGQTVRTAITDIEGRYGFLAPPDTYRLEASKTHYQFPSDKLRGRRHDELYGDLYFGGTLAYRGEEVMRVNIPLDPIGFDWNEFAKIQGDYLKLFQTKLRWWIRLARVAYWFGFLFSIWLVWSRADYWSFFSLGLYLVLGLGLLWWRERYPPTALRRQGGDEVIAFAIIRLFLSGTAEQVKATVTNLAGRFYVLVTPGVYDLTVEEKMPDGSYSEIYRQTGVNLKKGIFKRDIIVD